MHRVAKLWVLGGMLRALGVALNFVVDLGLIQRPKSL